MRRFSVLALLLLAQLAAVRTASAEDRFALSAEAVPTCILADGKSYSQIAISITTMDGHPAPDGTQVQVSTTAGSVTRYASSGGGRATAILTSTSSPQIAVVTCSAGGASASVQVEFSASAGDFTAGPKIIRMEGGALAYSVERDVILASDAVSTEYNGFTMHAASTQVCESFGTIRAQGEVKISRGDASVSADAVVYDLRSDRCRLLSGADVSNCSAGDLFKPEKHRKSNAGPTTSNEFAPLTADSTETWIVGRKLTLFPSQKIQFSRASVYIGNTHVVDLPHYFYDYGNRGALMDQIRYTQYEGFVADIPMYYRVTDSSSGALKLRYAERGSDFGGAFHPRKGPSLALDQAYSLGPRSDGRIFIDSVTDDARSLEMTHHSEFGSLLRTGRLDMSLRYQPDANFARNVYTAYLNASASGKNYDYYVSGFIGGSQVPVWDPANVDSMQYATQANSSIRASIRPRSGFSLGSWSFSPDLSLAYGRLGYGISTPSNECVYESLGLSFHSTPTGSRTMSLSFDGTSEFTSADDGRTGVSFRCGANLRRGWKGGSASLSYTLNLSSGAVANLYSTGVHTIGGNLYAGSGGKWNCYAYFGYGLDTARLNVSSSAMYQLNRWWKVRGEYSLYRYRFDASGYSFTSDMSYFKAGIYRPIGPYEIGLAWSPTGQEYWSTSTQKLWIEVGLSGF